MLDLSMAARATRRDAVLVVVLTLLVFAPILANGWVEWDDLFNFGDNPHYRGLGWTQIRWMFTSAWGGHWAPLGRPESNTARAFSANATTDGVRRAPS